MPQTLCERVASPLLELHRKTTSPVAIGVLAVVALSIVGYGLSADNHHVIWFGMLLTVTSWYGFLLSGGERLLAAKDKEISALHCGKADTH
ncbi:MAG: hypothetical protein V4719_06405 [Planctomycetota bacterium]